MDKKKREGRGKGVGRRRVRKYILDDPKRRFEGKGGGGGGGRGRGEGGRNGKLNVQQAR